MFELPQVAPAVQVSDSSNAGTLPVNGGFLVTLEAVPSYVTSINASVVVGSSTVLTSVQLTNNGNGQWTLAIPHAALAGLSGGQSLSVFLSYSKATNWTSSDLFNLGVDPVQAGLP